ncbi:MAG: threonine--tRNA ligase [bacterium]|nr:threonine--tRNA ligase [bacterium]
MTDEKMHNIRHSFAHILAAAVLKFFPEAKLGVGPVIDNGCFYDFLLPRTLAPEDIKNIEREMKKIIGRNLPFQGQEVSAEEARTIFAKQPFKLELINDLQKHGTTVFDEIESNKKIQDTKYEIQDTKITIYKTGDFLDLCRGGHAQNTKELNPDAFKIEKFSGAYWRGDQSREQMQRIYVVAFETKEELDKYLWQQEEAKKRDHRVLGEKLKLFTFAPEVGPGLPLWLPNGTIIRDQIETYAKEIEAEWGYQRVSTPHIAKEDLYKMSGHIPYYADSMYPPMKLDDGNYYLKAMNCPHTHMIYRAQPHSYRELPIRYAEYGTVYRYELSGTLAGLLRVRGFAQNDAHIYCTKEQAEDEFLKVMQLHEFWYKKVFGIKDFHMRLSLPSADKAKYAGLPEGWQKAVGIIRGAMKRSKLPYTEVEGEAAFYGPKVDFQIKSVIGREETASTNQLDFLAAERFNLAYADADGKEKPVYVIHRAPLGSHERFIAFLIEHYAGAFPAWLHPVQVAVLSIGKGHVAYAKKIAKSLEQENIRTLLRDDNESVGKKIRESEMQKIPYVLILGDKEKSKKTVAVRQRGKGDIGAMKLEKFLKKISDEIKKKK